MAQLANCPQCEHDLLIPDGVVAGAWARCPSCRAFFQLSDAKPREISTLEVVESASDPDASDLNIESNIDDNDAARTITDFSSMATWSGDGQDDMDNDIADDADDAASAKLHIPEELEAEDLRIVEETRDAHLHLAEERDDAELDLFNERDSLDEETLEFSAKADEEDEEELDFAEGLAALKNEFGGSADVDAETPASETPALETPEAAAQRIDAWFRSAKTLPDVPPLGDVPPFKPAALDDSDDRETEPWPSAANANNATIDLGSRGVDDLDLSDDFELDAPAESPQDIATWDDSQHMDRLLAGIAEQPHDEYVPSVQEEMEPVMAEPRAEVTAEWQPDASLSTMRQAESAKPKRSIVRTMVMTVLGGLLAIPLAGYTLLWLKGPDADFLGVAQYLPKAILPGSFNEKPKRFAPAPVQPQPEETPAEAVADAPAQPADAPAEKQATFTEPVDAKKAGADSDNRYGTAATTAEKPAVEPGTFDAPPATPVKEAAPQNVAVQIAGEPKFSIADLTATLQAAKDAEPGLVNGSMTDGRDVARTKGISYSVLADLAQKVMFVDAAAQPADAEKLQHEAAELFRTALATPHTRDEVAQIVPMWIGSANRKHGGVFFAGSLVGNDNKGSVSESSVDLGGGKPLSVLLPPALSEQLKGSAAPVVVVGWIVDNPAAKVTGYTGNAPQAIVASKLVPLE